MLYNKIHLLHVTVHKQRRLMLPACPGGIRAFLEHHQGIRVLAARFDRQLFRPAWRL